MEWQPPRIRILLGDWEVLHPQSVTCAAAAGDMVDVALVEVDNALGQAPGAAVGDGAVVAAGYESEGLATVFGGACARVERQRLLSVRAEGAGALLRTATVCRAWRRCTPADVVREAVRDAGVPDGLIYVAAVGPRRACFVAPSLTVEQVIRSAERAWGLRDHVAYFEPATGEFYWGPWGESPRASGQVEREVFAHGDNLLDLHPAAGGQGEAEVLFSPRVRHSEVVRLVDPEFFGLGITARVERVRHEITPAAARTRFAWRAV